VVLSYPRGQAWNMKRPTLCLEADAANAAAAALARAGGAGSPTNRGARKDVRPDLRGIKPAKSPEPADPAPSEPGLAPITGDPAVAVLKVTGVLQEVPLGWEAERAHLKQQIEALRAAMRYCPVLSYALSPGGVCPKAVVCVVTNHLKNECLTWALGVVCVLHSSNAADRMRMSADFEKLQAENKELRAVLAGRGVLAPPAQGTSDATGLPLEEALAPPPVLPALRE
jgi:hypothetical protein